MTLHEMEFEDFEGLMMETPVGDNYGRTAVQGSEAWERDWNEMSSPRRMPIQPDAQYEFLADSGWLQCGPNEGHRGGLTSHFGVLHPDEYVDTVQFRFSIEYHLHCSVEEFERWYGKGARGRPRREDADRRMTIRARVDPVLLEVIEAGGHVEWLARVLGVDKGRIYEAAHRARQARRRTREDDPQHHPGAAHRQHSHVH